MSAYVHEFVASHAGWNRIRKNRRFPFASFATSSTKGSPRANASTWYVGFGAVTFAVVIRNARGLSAVVARSPSPVDSPVKVRRTFALMFGSLFGFGTTASPTSVSRSFSEVSAGGVEPAQNFAETMSV